MGTLVYRFIADQSEAHLRHPHLELDLTSKGRGNLRDRVPDLWGEH